MRIFKIKEEIKPNGITLKGNMYDVVEYLKKEQERCSGKMPVSKYIRLRKLERAESEQFGVDDFRGRYASVKR